MQKTERMKDRKKEKYKVITFNPSKFLTKKIY